MRYVRNPETGRARVADVSAGAAHPERPTVLSKDGVFVAGWRLLRFGG
jgi:hypothetical protein